MMWRNLKHYFVLFILLGGVISVVQAGPKQAIWIDSDPACGNAKTDDDSKNSELNVFHDIPPDKVMFVEIMATF